MSECRKASYHDLRCAVLHFGRKSDFHTPECESGDWAKSTAVAVLVAAGLLDGTFYHGGPRLTEDGEGIYQRLVVGGDSPALRKLISD